ncbi:hypothetical protein Tco_0803469 [Tanacetum coccineum]|uniref:Uncharacterized protein n=1 Tax=Tanacetum coccineum TaxID=301880 RepID=A0ABQ5A4F5_9ASTR
MSPRRAGLLGLGPFPDLLGVGSPKYIGGRIYGRKWRIGGDGTRVAGVVVLRPVLAESKNASKLIAAIEAVIRSDLVTTPEVEKHNKNNTDTKSLRRRKNSAPGSTECNVASVDMLCPALPIAALHDVGDVPSERSCGLEKSMFTTKFPLSFLSSTVPFSSDNFLLLHPCFNHLLTDLSVS